MVRLFAIKLAQALLTLFLVSILVFFLIQVLPGDVGRTVLGPYATNAQVRAFDTNLGLNKPLVSQYFSWLGHFLTGNWGTSYLLKLPVRPLVLSRLGHSLILALLAFLVGIPISLLAGFISGILEDSKFDRFIGVAGLSLIAIPEFISGSILIIVFSVFIHAFPAISNVPNSIGGVISNLLLPSVALALVIFGYLSRMARAGAVEAVHSNYYRTAKLKGLPNSYILRKHVAKNALMPTIGVISVQIGWLIGGLVVIETLFNYPGIGGLMLTSALGHDVPVLEACVILSAASYTVANLLADVAYYLLNPKLRAASKTKVEVKA